MTDLDTTRAQFAQALDGVDGFGARVLFDCGDAGAILVDGTGHHVSVSDTAGDADCIISMSAHTLGLIVEGELDETTAFTRGEMMLSGEIRLATLVSNLLRSRSQEMVQAEIGDAS